VDHSHCDVPCPGKSLESCGGALAMVPRAIGVSIYAIMFINMRRGWICGLLYLSRYCNHSGLVMSKVIITALTARGGGGRINTFSDILPTRYGTPS
jgi:hypothetical protein